MGVRLSPYPSWSSRTTTITIPTCISTIKGKKAHRRLTLALREQIITFARISITVSTVPTPAMHLPRLTQTFLLFEDHHSALHAVQPSTETPYGIHVVRIKPSPYWLLVTGHLSLVTSSEPHTAHTSTKSQP